MNLSFSCPFATDQDHCFELFGIKNYISHLKKCCQIALYVQDYENTFHLCPYCIQAFISLEEAQQHRDRCKDIKNICLIKDDQKWHTKLGQSASKDLDQLQNLLNTGQIKSQNQKMVTPASQPYYNTRLPLQRNLDSIKTARVTQMQSKRQIMEEDCLILDDLGQNKLQFKVSERDSILKPLRYQLFSGVTLPQIDIRFFQHKLTVDKLLNLLKSNFNISIEPDDNFLKNKVMEFVEDIEGDIEQEIEDVVHYSIKKEKNGHTTIWILSNEISTFFKQFISEYPWALFRISSNKIQTEDINHPLMKTQKMKEAQTLQSKKDKLKSLLIRDQQLSSQIQYEIGLTTQAQQQIKDSIKNYSKQQTQLVMNERIRNDLQQILQTKYEQQLQIMQQSLQSYLDAKKRELNDEVDQKLKSSEEILAKYQPMIDNLQNEEELLNGLENELKKKFLLLEEDAKQLIQAQTHPRRMPSQVQRKPLIRINQEMCIECKTNKRNTLIKPCQHCLFCEQCFIKLSQKGIQCPLKNSKRCTRTNFLKKCIILNFGEIS